MIRSNPIPKASWTKSYPGEQVTPLDDRWSVVYHTEFKNDPWWAVRHLCDDGEKWGMAWVSNKTVCNGCAVTLPSEIEGLLQMMEWKRC